MTEQTETLAILFADISGSTMLYETLGNGMARQIVVRCLAIMSSRLEAHRGTLIKTIGDEIMCTFPSAETALHAACDMQDAVENGKPGGETPIYVRIGFNYGEVIHDASDVHGDAVNVAARITQVARARQILATAAVIEALPPELRLRARHIRQARIKGRQAPLDLFQIGWIAEGIENVRIGNPANRKPEGQEAQLVLRHFDQQFTVDERNPTATLGRSESCAIAILDACASDQHATVQHQLGRFYISDRSARGTYIRFRDGDTVHIVGESTMLRGPGAIALGRPFSENPAGSIEFSIELVPTPD
jgi:class 3 adenylate cyclase